MPQHPSQESESPFSHDDLPVTRLEHGIIVGQVSGISAKLELIWEEIKKTASAETVAKVEQVQEEHAGKIVALEGEMETVKVEVARSPFALFVAPAVVIYEKIFVRLTWSQIKIGLAVLAMIMIGWISYWGTVEGGWKDQDEQDHRQMVETDSIQHAHRMEELKLRIEMQNAIRPAPPQITVEQDGTITTETPFLDSLPANFGIDPPLYPPTPIDAP